ncbi:hypothetical protein NCER_101438 [Vairimorpha ceranae BRL01]|uniref:Uncharacterized protein n=1 Tax=Vairimorpha ceranae (strain BRL01) TaxID=578460 RepID=C4VA12_VAIC1|nr:hypothetical protein NCER_101438 [Vairimorpha ceranae BRL01]
MILWLFFIQSFLSMNGYDTIYQDADLNITVEGGNSTFHINMCNLFDILQKRKYLGLVKMYNFFNTVWDSIVDSSSFKKYFIDSETLKVFNHKKRFNKHMYLLKAAVEFEVDTATVHKIPKFYNENDKLFIRNMLTITKNIYYSCNACENYVIGVNDFNSKELEEIILRRMMYSYKSTESEYPIFAFKPCDQLSDVFHKCNRNDTVNYRSFLPFNPVIEEETTNTFSGFLSTIQYYWNALLADPLSLTIVIISIFALFLFVIFCILLIKRVREIKPRRCIDNIN